MADGTALDTTQSNTPLVDDLEDRRRRLEVQKLDYEIRELSLAWWKKPTWMAAVASVLVAAIGLIWAASTGFFDTERRDLESRKRELQIELRDLQSARDEQSVKFNKERSSYDAQVSALRKEANRLRTENQSLNTPQPAGAAVHRGPWDYNGRGPTASFAVYGYQLGDVEGSAWITLVLYGSRNDSVPAYGKPQPVAVTGWSNRAVSVEAPYLNHSYVAKFIRDTAAGKGWSSSDVYLSVAITIRRPDGKGFTQEVNIPFEITKWALSGQ